MEEVCTCQVCGNQSWAIYKDRVKCSKCNKSYGWIIGLDNSSARKAEDLVHHINMPAIASVPFGHE